jgi:hypothetical protein
MTLFIPDEREVPDLDRVLAAVLADGMPSGPAIRPRPESPRNRRRWLVPAAAAACVALVVAGVLAVSHRSGEQPGPASPSPTGPVVVATATPSDPTPRPDEPVSQDTGEAVPASVLDPLVRTCKANLADVVPTGQARPQVVGIRHAVMSGLPGDLAPSPVLVTAQGVLVACVPSPMGTQNSPTFALGGMPAAAPPQVSPERPVVVLSAEAPQWASGVSGPQDEAATWFLVDASVGSVRLRVELVGEGFARWYVATPVDGLVRLAFAIPQPSTAGQVRVDLQVLDRSGRPFEVAGITGTSTATFGGSANFDGPPVGELPEFSVPLLPSQLKPSG